MPRTTKVESPGCPTLRALTFDVLGLIKVVEARGKKGGTASVVERWGDPESGRNVVAVSMDDSEHDPLLAVARKSGLIEVLSPLSGDLRVSIVNSGDTDPESQDDNVVGLHIFKRPELGSSSRSCTLLTCSIGGHANLRSFKVPKTGQDSVSNKPVKTWDVCASGNISFTKVDGSEQYALFGGKGVEVNVWDLESCTKIWNAKSPPKNSLGIFTPTWFTSATFLSKDDHRKFVTGTNNHQVRLYDISAQRRPVISFEFRETPIKAVAEDLDGNTIYAGNGSGDLASFDIRTGKLLGCFLGKGAGSIRSMARHPELPVLASCGLDSYVRFWDVNSRQLLSAVFLKQPLSNVVFDSHFKEEAETVVPAEDIPSYKAQSVVDSLDDEEEESLPVKRKKTPKEHGQTKKSKKRRKMLENDEVDKSDADKVGEPLTVKQKKTSKSKKKSKKTESNEVDLSEANEAEESLPVKQKKTSKSKKKSKKTKSNEVDLLEANEEEESLPVKQKKLSKEHDETKKLKSKKRSKKIHSDEVYVSEAVVPKKSLDEEVEKSLSVKGKKRSKEHDEAKKLKSKKRSRKIESDDADVS